MKDRTLKFISGRIKTWLIIFLTAFFILICFYAAYEKRDVDADRNYLSKEQEVSVVGQKALVNTELGEIVSDLLYLEESPGFRNYIYGTGSKTDLENNWRLFAGKMKKYDHIRYLDENGNEKIRINFNGGKPVVVPEGELQNKSDRQCFVETMKLDNGSIYRSSFDLNVENGKIENPIKPVIRFSMPVFDLQGTKRGIIVVNYAGSYIIDRIKSITHELNYAQLINEKGYWLSSPEQQNEWGFMYPDKADKTFANKFPDEWSRIITEKNGQFFSSKGLFTFRLVEPEVDAKAGLFGTNDENTVINGADNAWFLVSHVPAEAAVYANSANSYLISLQKLVEFPVALLAIIFIAGVFSILLLLYLVENERLREIATHDHMTGCLNRRAGTRIIENEMKKAERDNKPISMLLLDIDHFKKVNDNWGHIIGDKVLKHVARILQNKIRIDDCVIRTGGEEFLILLPDTGAEDAVLIAERLRVNLEEYNHNPVGRVTSSFGVAEREKGENRLQWYKRVDDALYHAKETGRNRVFNAADLAKSLPVVTVQLEWKDEWASGNEIIDNQHRELVKLGNELVFSALSESSKNQTEEKLDEFLDHVITHFNSEEAIFVNSGFEGGKEHSKIHKLIVADALRLKEAYIHGKLKPSAFFSFIVDDVIVGHMINEDKNFFPFVGKNFSK